MKYKDWLAEWLKNYIQITNKQRTCDRYNDIINRFILPNLGEYELCQITPIVLQKFITLLSSKVNKKTNKCISASYINVVISVVRSSLKTAYTLGYLTEYTADKIKRPKISEKAVQCFTKLEQKKIEQFILTSKKQRLKGVIICFYTGLRIGELLALTWDDIDFVKKRLQVAKSCYDGYIDGKHCVINGTPKTENSIRQIPLSKSIVELLKNMKKQNQSEYVISYSGKQILVRSYQRSFELLLKRLNISHKGFHATRHTFATRAIECGIDVKTLSEILGHKNAMVTLNRYAHSLWEHKSDMMNKLGKLL